MSWWGKMVDDFSDSLLGDDEIRKGRAAKAAADEAAEEARKPSKSEITLAKRAIDGYNRLKDFYYPIQEQAAAEAGADRSGMLAGRANADLNAQTYSSKQGVHRVNQATGFAPDGGGAVSRLASVFRANADGQGAVDATSKQAAQNIIDTKRQNIAGLAHGLEGDSLGASTQLARMAVNTGLNGVKNRFATINAQNQAKLTKQQARGGIISSALGAAASFGMNALMPTSAPSLAQSTADQSFSFNPSYGFSASDLGAI